MTTEGLSRERRELGRIAIVGAGQIGTMLGLALRDAGCADVWLQDKEPATAELSLGLGAASGVISGTKEVLECDTIILALPVPEIVKTIEELGPRLRRGTFVGDTGSAKTAVTTTMRTHIPSGVHAIGGHPMVGTARPGPLGARPHLLKGAPFVFTEFRDDQTAIERAGSLATLVGARMCLIDAETHDRCLARTSHVAHVAAFALASLNDNGSSVAEGLSSPGYDRAVRLAGSDTEMVAGFLNANRPYVKRAVDDLISKLGDASRVLSDAPDELTALLTTWQRSALGDFSVAAAEVES
jgi:prephenate dehydrogenase